ncbi:MAG: hypothetical protein AAF716_21070 [Cyanobacteria bacterium P01_D01_bin.1]
MFLSKIRHWQLAVAVVATATILGGSYGHTKSENASVTAQLEPQLSYEPIQTQYGPDGSEVDLMTVEITGDVLTITLRYRSQPESRLSTRYGIDEVSYTDDMTAERYGVIRDSADEWLASPQDFNGNFRINLYDNAETAWFKFPAPPLEVDSISINIPEVSPFNGVTVER